MRIILLVLSLVFASNLAAKQVLVSAIEFEGNSRTKRAILLRECAFAVGELVESNHVDSLVERSRQNIWNLNIFNQVTATTTPLGDGFKVTFCVIERWYWLPKFTFENAEVNFNTWWLNKDFNRLTYGLKITNNNFLGALHQLQFSAQLGFARGAGISYGIPYLNTKKTIGIKAAYNYFSSTQAIAAIQNGERIFLQESQELFQKHVAELEINYRKNLYHKHAIAAKVHNYSIDSTLLAYDFLPQSNMLFLELNYHYFFSNRDNISYPLRGIRIEAIPSVLQSFNSQNTVAQIFAVFHHHLPIQKKWNFAYAIHANATTSHNNLPFPFLNSLGMNDYVRGYEYFAYRTPNYVLTKTNFKRELLNIQKFNWPFIRQNRFKTSFLQIYGNAFVDAAYQSSNYQRTLLGYGLGIDFVTYYDTVFRVEFSRTITKQNGIYLHFTKSI